MLVAIVSVLPVGLHDDRLDRRQHVGKQSRARAHRIRHHQNCPVIEGVGASEAGPNLTATSADHRPRHHAVVGVRRVLGVRALGASYPAGLAVFGSSPEVPSGEFDNSFFSSSRRSAGVA